jgi:hypothetical protein
VSPENTELPNISKESSNLLHTLSKSQLLVSSRIIPRGCSAHLQDVRGWLSIGSIYDAEPARFGSNIVQHVHCIVNPARRLFRHDSGRVQTTLKWVYDHLERIALIIFLACTNHWVFEIIIVTEWGCLRLVKSRLFDGTNLTGRGKIRTLTGTTLLASQLHSVLCRGTNIVKSET